MTWYRQPGDDQDAHRGTLARGMVHTACGQSIAAFSTVRLDGPPEDHEACELCATGRTRHIDDTDSDYPARMAALGGLIRDAWPARCGLTQLAVAAEVLTVAVLLLVIYLAWPR